MKRGSKIEMKEIKGRVGEKLFFHQKPRSRVKKDIVNEIQNYIDRAPRFGSPFIIDYLSLQKRDEEYYLLRDYNNGLPREVPISGVFNGDDISLAQRVEWGLQVARAGEAAEAQDHLWPGLNDMCLRLTDDNKIKIFPPEIVQVLGQYRPDIQPLIPRENYTPPEIIEGSSWTTEGVLYSWGVLLYFLVTGAAPFSVHTKADTYDKILTSSFIDPCYMNPNISKRLNKFIKKLLFRNPKQRYHSWQKARADLEKLCSRNGYQADNSTVRKNTRRRKFIRGYTAVRDRILFSIKRHWKPLTAVLVMVFLMVMLNFMTGETEYITEETPPGEVVAVFYEGLQEKEEEKIKASGVTDLQELEVFLSEAYIMEQMRRQSEGLPLGVRGMYDLEEEDMVFGLRNLEIEQLENEEEPLFRGEYVFFLNPNGEQQSEAMEDILLLEKEKGIWQITEVWGSFEKLLSGELNLEKGVD